MDQGKLESDILKSISSIINKHQEIDVEFYDKQKKDDYFSRKKIKENFLIAMSLRKKEWDAQEKERNTIATHKKPVQTTIEYFKETIIKSNQQVSSKN